MSHFLARLVERTRGTAPRVEPIIAPRFAATPLPEIASESEAAAPAPQTAIRKGAELQINQSAAQNEQPIATREKDDLLAKQTIESTPTTLLVPLEQEIGEIVPRSTWTSGSSSLRSDELALAQSAPAPVVVRRTNNHPLSTRAQSLNGLAPRIDTSSLPDELPPNEPPIVHVTIGRIEVRATPAATPTPRKPSRTAPPKLTLDAYLKERQEGRR